MNIPLVNLARRHATVGADVEARVTEVLRSGQYIGGPIVAEVEAQVATWFDAAAAVGVANGTDALMLALQVVGVRPGDEVVIPALSFFATAGAVLGIGATPVVVDVRQDALIDPDAVAEAMSPNVRAVVPVHLFGGTTAPIAPGVPVIDDAAQAVGALPPPRHGVLATVSAYPTKVWGAAGDAGFVVGDATSVDEVRTLANHGRDPHGHYDVVRGVPGRNCRLDALQAAVLAAHAPHLAARRDARQGRAHRYDEGLPPHIVPLPRPPGSAVSQYCVLVTDRPRIRRHLADSGIQTGVYYPRLLHQEPALRGRCRVRPTPVAEHLAPRLLALPIVDCTDREVDHVLDALHAPVAS